MAGISSGRIPGNVSGIPIRRFMARIAAIKASAACRVESAPEETPAATASSRSFFHALGP